MPTIPDDSTDNHNGNNTNTKTTTTASAKSSSSGLGMTRSIKVGPSNDAPPTMAAATATAHRSASVSGGMHGHSLWLVGVNTPIPEQSQKQHGTNAIRTRKYTLLTFIPLNLYEQFHRLANMFFLFMAIIAFIPQTQSLRPETAVTPLASVLLVTALRDYYEDTKRGNYDRETNSRKTRVLRNGRFVEIQWQDVRVGDIVKVLDGEHVPADLFLLASSDDTGVCHIETANLDGETNLKVRDAYAETHKMTQTDEECARIRALLSVEQPNNNLFKLDGKIEINGGEPTPFNMSNTILRGCQLRNIEWVHGIVIYTGPHTKVMQNMRKPRLKRTRLDGKMNRQILGVFLVVFFCCTSLAIFGAQWNGDHKDAWYLDLTDGNSYTGLVTFFSYVLLIHSMVPLAAYVSVELARLMQGRILSSDLEMYDEVTDTPAQARTTSLMEELGMVQYLLSDKTGTLTQNIMEFTACSVDGVPYGLATEAQPVKPTAQRSNPCAHARPMACFADERMYRVAHAPHSDAVEHFLLCLALCHHVHPVKNTPGDIRETGADDFNAQSPDEAALVKAARDLGYSFYASDNQNHMFLNILGKERTFKLLETIEFSSDRKRMTVFVQEVTEGRFAPEILVLSKGADDIMLELLDPATNKEKLTLTKTHLDMFARKGLRTLVLGGRIISEITFNDWKHRWLQAELDNVADPNPDRLVNLAMEMEREYTLLGATAVDDLLQEDVANTIAKLKVANISVWVLTGDKQETAVSIGHSCKLLDEKQATIFINTKNKGQDVEQMLRAALVERAIPADADPRILAKRRTVANPYAIVIDGSTLFYVLQSEELSRLFVNLSAGAAAVVCCRTAPLQKAVVVGLVRRHLEAITMAIGDGANDVSMLKEANIGVGISGKEGMQAVLASDYSIAKFRYLQRLLLVHGRYSYNRVTRLVLYCFYKNYAYVLANFYFGWFCAASAQTIYENRYVMLYNVVFTSVPLLLVSMTEQDVSPESALKFPQLYRDSQRNALFKHSTFWLHILDAVYQSLVVYFFAMWALNTSNRGRDMDMFMIGTVMFTSVVLMVNIKLLLDCQHWNTWVVTSVAVSIFLYFVFVLLYHAIVPQLNPIFYGFYNDAVTATFWTCVFLSIVVGLLPSFVIRCIMVTLYPSAAQIVRERELLKINGGAGAPSDDIEMTAGPTSPVTPLPHSNSIASVRLEDRKPSMMSVAL